MTRIILSTNDIFEKDGRMIKILTDGINTTERFNDNPIMLFDHNTSTIVGTWDAVERTSFELSAIPNFDDDILSVEIKNKFEKGTLKSASIGIEVEDAFMDGDVLVVSKSILLEASLVGIPANKNAKKINLKKDSVLLFSKSGDKFNTGEHIKKLNKMTNEKVKVEDEKVVDTLSPIDELKLSLTEKESTIDDLKASKVELGLDITKLNTEVTSLKESTESMKLSLTEKDSTIDELNATILELKNDKLNVLLNSAIAEGKITKEAKPDFLELAYEKAESILQNIIPSSVSLSETLNLNKGSKSEEKTFDWYLKNDKDGLTKLSKENPALYKQLENNKYKNK